MNKPTLASAVSLVRSHHLGPVGAAVAFSPILFLLLGCATKCILPPADQTTFRSADQAVSSAVAAIRAHDKVQLKKILGPEAEEILSSGDEVADRNRMDEFLKAYDEKHELLAAKDGAMTLVVGKNEWPMPIPIVQSGGQWRFDTKAGKEEIRNRRIGRNELDAIQTCLAILDAQREYISHDRNVDGLRDYATKFISDPGKKNGLYWPTAAHDKPSPLGPLFAEAAAEGYKPEARAAGAKPRPFHGYYFRILTAQGTHAAGGAMDYLVGGKLIGGFAVIAWPADYDNSGIMTFLMNHEGIVYERDLGEDTAKTAAAMNAYDPGPEWKKVEPGK